MRNENPRSWRASLGKGPAVTMLDSVTRRRASKPGGACVGRILGWLVLLECCRIRKSRVDCQGPKAEVVDCAQSCSGVV